MYNVTIIGGTMIYECKIVNNKYNDKQIVLPRPSLKEVEVFERSILVSETDLEGIIVYTNRRYESIAGYGHKELIGFPHHIVRHPDMPSGVFRAMWKIISEKRIWRGYIKHLCKDGSFFWTLTYVQAKVDEKEEIIGYISVGKIAYVKSREVIAKKYKELMGDEHIDDKYFMASYDYYESQIGSRDFLSEYIAEMTGLDSK